MCETSASLLERLRDQPDSAAWTTRLVDLYTPLLRGWLSGRGLQACDVEDLVQDVLAVVVCELPHFRHNRRTGAFRRWLRTILVHRLRDFWRCAPQPSAADRRERIAEPPRTIERSQ